MENKKKTFTEAQVKKLLQEQKKACARAIDSLSISQNNARKKIMETELAKFEE